MRWGVLLSFFVTNDDVDNTRQGAEGYLHNEASLPILILRLNVPASELGVPKADFFNRACSNTGGIDRSHVLWHWVDTRIEKRR